MKELNLEQVVNDLLSKEYDKSVKALAYIEEVAEGSEKEILEEEVINKILFFASDKDASVRQMVFSILEKFKISSGIELLLHSAKDDRSLRVRVQAILALGSVCPKELEQEVSDFLISTLIEGKAAPLRAAAAKGLGKMKKKNSVEPLIKALIADPDDHVRDCAVRALGIIGDKRATDSLINLIKNEDDFSTRMSAIVSLGQIGTTKALDELISILKNDDDFSNRGAACAGLAYSLEARVIDQLLETALYDKKPVPRRAAALALGELYLKFWDERIITVLETLEKNDEDDAVTHNARFWLEKIREK